MAPHLLKVAVNGVPTDARALQIDHATVGVIERGSHVGGELSLGDEAYALRIERAAVIAEGAGVNVRKNIACVGGNVADTQQSRVLNAIAEVSKLEVVVAR